MWPWRPRRHCCHHLSASLAGDSTAFGRVVANHGVASAIVADSSVDPGLLFDPSAFANGHSAVSATLSAAWATDADIVCGSAISPGLNYDTSATFVCDSSVESALIFVPTVTITCDSGITATASVEPCAASLVANSGTSAALLAQFAGDADLVCGSSITPRLGVYPTTAALSCNSRFIAAATVLPIPLPPPPINVSALVAGYSALSARPTVTPIPQPSASLLASSSLAAQSRAHYSAASSLAGVAVLIAFFGTPTAGLAAGAATVTANPIHLTAASGTSAGVTTITASAVQVFINTAQTSGTSTFTDSFQVNAMAVSSGTSTVSDATPTLVRFSSGRAASVALLQWSYPLPIYGSSNVSAAPNVTQVLPVHGGHCEQCRKECPYCHRRHRRWEHRHEEHDWDGRYQDGLFNPQPWQPHVHRPPRSFEYGHTFSKGDLSFYVKDRSGNPVAPFSVAYTLYRVHPGGSMQQVGPYDRTAAKSGVGEYYVTGTAGENGQPGWWVVQWCYQQVFNGQPVVVDECFHVVEAATTHISNDSLCRVKKFGWD